MGTNYQNTRYDFCAVEDTDLSDEQFSVLLYKKKSYIIPDVSALINFLNPHFTVILGLYCRIPLLLVLAGVICSLIDITSSGSTFKQFAYTISGYDRTLNSLSCLFSSFNELSTRWIKPSKSFYISSLIVCQQSR